MLGDTIREYRKANNMSQDELAEKLDVTRQSISLWETGQTQPTLENIVALSGLFHVSIDTLLKTESGTPTSNETAPEVKESKTKLKTNKALLIGILSGAAVALIAAVVLILSGIKPSAKKPEQSSTQNTTNVTVTTEDESVISTAAVTTTTAPPQTTPVRKVTTTTAKSNAPQTTAARKVTTTTTTQSSPSTTAKKTEVFNLFAYCKDFAIQKGNLNGDCTIYQQPSGRYGGYDGEYFSISYWGDSNMVEFCLHCPLDDTFSINFYLRMRGGYNGTYEYLSSRYYRSDGESIRSATGYIDPSVFSDHYPLNCSKYIGSADKQNDFMEESRVGICDLIKCLKNFVEIEGMTCDFSAFGFSNF